MEVVMRKVARILAGLLCGLLVAGSASAEWGGKGKLGGVLTRGNSETTTLSANADVINRLARWNHKFGSSVLRTLNEDVITADRWEARAESEYEPTDRTFTFASARYEDDQFTDYEYQVTAAIGYGYHFIDTVATTLDAKVGVGVRATELRLSGETEREDILRGTLEFKHQLTETTLVFNKYLIESGSTNTFMQNQFGVEVKINHALALGLGYELRRNTDVLPGTRNSDQLYTANLVFGFGVPQ
jgi:putative salt-induced outer membrane protein